MEDIDEFQFHPTSTDNSDGGIDGLTIDGGTDGLEYEYKLDGVMISSCDVGGSSAVMLLPAVQQFQEAPAETAKGDDNDGGMSPPDIIIWDIDGDGNGSYIHDWGLNFG